MPAERTAAAVVRMSPLQDLFEATLSVAPQFSTTETDAMVERDQLLREIRSVLADHVREISPELAPDTELRVKEGGRQANYSPTPWVRVYSKDHSPSAQSGAYLVYLFAADGSAVSLSLNQGTSEWRSGHMRPVNDRDELRARAAESRRRLRDLETTALAAGGLEDIDLRWEEATLVGRESRMRIRNYEDANVLARVYPAGGVPDDGVLLQELSDFIPLLRRLYLLPDLEELDTPGTSPAGSTTATTRSRSRGRQRDPEVRRAVELYAEDQAIALLSKCWDQVRRVGHLHLGYDLECVKGDHHLHVEVKGLQSSGREVSLTRNEVNHLPSRGGDCPAGHALFVVADILVAYGDEIACSGGTQLFLKEWSPLESSLTAMEYAYRVPWVRPEARQGA